MKEKFNFLRLQSWFANQMKNLVIKTSTMFLIAGPVKPGIVPYAATFEKKSELWTKTWEKGNWGKARFSTSATFEGAEIKFHTV